MKKKLLSVMLAATMICGLLTGCGHSKTTETTDASVEVSGTAEETESTDTEKKVLRVGMECAYAPFNWTQESEEVANGEKAVPIYGTDYYAYGYDVMMAKKIADYLGWDLEIHKVEWTSIGMGLDSGDYDVIIAGMGWTEEREKSYDFTTPYYIRETVVTCKEGSDLEGITGLSQFAGKNITATTQLSTVWVEDINEIPDVTPGANYETTSECFMAVKNGTADICVIDRPTTLSALQTNDGLKIIELDENDTFSDAFTNVCIGVREGDTEFLNTIQGALDAIGWTEDNKAEMDKMMDEAIKLQPSAN